MSPRSGDPDDGDWFKGGADRHQASEIPTRTSAGVWREEQLWGLLTWLCSTVLNRTGLGVWTGLGILSSPNSCVTFLECLGTAEARLPHCELGHDRAAVSGDVTGGQERVRPHARVSHSLVWAAVRCGGSFMLRLPVHSFAALSQHEGVIST